jgi:hypothetical protein
VLPELHGRPVRVVIRASLGPHWAATSIPRRLIYLDREVLSCHGEFERILVHELFHFVWVRLSNQDRKAWSELLSSEMRNNAKGELGWSAERRREKVTIHDAKARSWAWRRYTCESFCDSAAWMYAGLRVHEEFSLSSRWTRRRAAWLENLATNGLRL